MPSQVKKFFVETVSQDNLKRDLYSQIKTSGGKLVNLKDLKDSGCYDKATIVGKISKVHDIEHLRNPANVIRRLELFEVDDKLNKTQTSQIFIVTLDKKLAFSTDVLTDKHYVAITGFEVVLISPKNGYLSLMVKTQESSSMSCFVCIEDVSASSMLPAWKKLNPIKIQDLEMRSDNVCFYGVVTFVGPTKPISGGTNKYSKVLSLIDESRKKLQCIIFSNNIFDYPAINEMNIVRIQRAKVGRYKGAMQVTVQGGNNILVFMPGAIDSFVPKHTSSAPILTKEDVIRVTELRKWSKRFLPTKCSLSEINTDDITTFNLECQVIARIESSTSKNVVLHIWDGTKPASCLQQPNFAADDSNNSSSCDSKLKEKLQEMMVEIYVEGHTDDYKKLKACDFILLKNLHFLETIANGKSDSSKRLKICMIDSSPSSNLTRVTPSQEFISKLVKASGVSENMLTQATEIKQTQQSQFSITYSEIHDETILSITGASGKIQPSSIQKVLKHKAPYKFHVIAKVKDCYPHFEPLEQFFSYVCPKCGVILPGLEIEEMVPAISGTKEYDCPQCAKTNECIGETLLIPKLGLKLLLEDETGQLEVMLWDKYAVEFFHGASAKSLTQDESKFKIVKDFYKRVKVDEDTLDCSIFSYNTVDGKRFQIFDTVLI